MRTMLLPLLPVVFSVASAAHAQNKAIHSLIDRFEAARLEHDPKALSSTLAPDYAEISPVGEVDLRDKVLGFYAPELKRPAPSLKSDEMVIHSRGNIAIVTMRKSFAFPNSAPRSVRVRYVAQRSGGTWQLISAQYTPIPPSSAN